MLSGGLHSRKNDYIKSIGFETKETFDMITIYQIQPSINDVDNYNAGKEVKALDARRKMIFGADKFDTSMLEYYSEAFAVYTDDLEEAFQLTNLFNDQTKIDVLGDNPTSSSVGDIFRLNERFYVVDNFGFKELRLFNDEVATLEGWELV